MRIAALLDVLKDSFTRIIMTLDIAQLDMRRAYFGGAPVIFASGLVWFVAGWLHIVQGQTLAQPVFLSAMVICHPLGIMVMREFMAIGRHINNNPLPRLTNDANFFLICGLIVAIIAGRQDPAMLFEIALFTLGVRYLILKTVYGIKAYWVAAAMLIGAACMSYVMQFSAGLSAFLGAYIELCFAGWMFWKMNRGASAPQ